MDASTLEILEFCSKKIVICTTVPKDADNAPRNILHSSIALSAPRYTDSTILWGVPHGWVIVPGQSRVCAKVTWVKEQVRNDR